MRPIFRMKLAFRIIMFIACQNSTHSEEQNVSFEKKGHLILHTLITITSLIRLPENALTRLCADQTANIHWRASCALARLREYAQNRLCTDQAVWIWVGQAEQECADQTAHMCADILCENALTRLCEHALARLQMCVHIMTIIINSKNDNNDINTLH